MPSSPLCRSSQAWQLDVVLGAMPEPQRGKGAGKRTQGRPTTAQVDGDPGARRGRRALLSSAGTPPSQSLLSAGSGSPTPCHAAPWPGLQLQGAETLVGRETWSCSRIPAPGPCPSHLLRHSNLLPPSLPPRAPRVGKKSQRQLPRHRRVSGSPAPGRARGGVCGQGCACRGVLRAGLHVRWGAWGRMPRGSVQHKVQRAGVSCVCVGRPGVERCNRAARVRMGKGSCPC